MPPAPSGLDATYRKRTSRLDRPVFISCASEDHAVGERVCRLLELEGIGSWIAPRDVRPGRDYGEQIIGAIESAPAFVLILTANANASVFVPKEVERAVSKRKTLFVLRVGEVAPSRALELFVSQSQWIDASTPPLEDCVHVLASAIRGERRSPPRSYATQRPAPSRPPGR
ncbi:MAG: toll/interleukin-1 receptor domain-containing protein [Candidatus Limnocylindrales bacterium]